MTQALKPSSPQALKPAGKSGNSVDLVPEMLATARRKLSTTIGLHAGWAEPLPFADSQPRSHCVVQHVSLYRPTYQRVIRNTARFETELRSFLVYERLKEAAPTC
ncbi:MAG: class I SAM-dependent methyltransferase [Salinisphaera sp.]|uniref:class I SAM-dependent methyltransferase n=1 Tax=Salinisphaera sp. TaxID=1914330 RepID=UPI003C7A637F